MPSESVVQWRPTFGDARPYENIGEIVGFVSYFERGLSPPSSNFFSRLLYYYGIQLHHLTPNSFVHMSVFVHLCEAYLGIEPHFDLFRHLFHLKPQPNSASLDVVGGAEIQLRQRMDRVYIPYKLSQKVIDWKPRWFYVENEGNSLPSILAGPPVQRAEWLKKPIDMSQIPELLEMIASLKQKGISGESVAFDWMKCRIQPLQALVTFGFEYRGRGDPSQCSEEEISNGGALRRIQRLFEKVEHVCISSTHFRR